MAVSHAMEGATPDVGPTIEKTVEPTQAETSIEDGSVETEEEMMTVMRNMVGTAIQFGLGLMVVLVMILVAGLFVANVPMSGAFSGAMDTAINIGGAGFTILVVTLLVIPIGGLVMFFARSGLGRFMGGGGR